MSVHIAPRPSIAFAHAHCAAKAQMDTSTSPIAVDVRLETSGHLVGRIVCQTEHAGLIDDIRRDHVRVMGRCAQPPVVSSMNNEGDDRRARSGLCDSAYRFPAGKRHSRVNHGDLW